MAVRSKGRNSFSFNGRDFIWWVDGEKWLRIASADKNFVVAVPLGRIKDEDYFVTVSGPEFPGLDEGKRPIHLMYCGLEGNNMGAIVENILKWCFNADKKLEVKKREV